MTLTGKALSAFEEGYMVGCDPGYVPSDGNPLAAPKTTAPAPAPAPTPSPIPIATYAQGVAAAQQEMAQNPNVSNGQDSEDPLGEVCEPDDTADASAGFSPYDSGAYDISKTPFVQGCMATLEQAIHAGTWPS